MPAQIELALRLDDEFSGQVWMYTDKKTNELSLDALPILEQLEQRLLDPVLARLKPTIDKKQRISQKALQQAGLQAVFNQTNLSFDITIPLDLQKPRQLSLFRSRRPPYFDPKTLVQPAKLSAYVNLRTGLQYKFDEGGTEHELVNTQLESAINMYDWVLKQQWTYTESSDSPWKRDYTRLVFDDTKNLRRYRLGDVNISTQGYQTNARLLGFSLNKNFQLNPYQNFSPRGKQVFTLTSDSKVEIFSNGFEMKRALQLRAGEYHLQDLRLFQGANDILLKITDSFGNVSEIKSTLFSAGNMLEPNIKQYAVSFGAMADYSESSYAMDDLMFSGFYRRGIAENLTLGINFQANRWGKLLGMEYVYPTRLAILNGDIALRWDQTDGFAYVAKLNYQHNYIRTELNSSPKLHWNWLAEYRSADFAPLRLQDEKQSPNEMLQNLAVWKLNSRLNYNIAEGLYAGVSLDYETPLKSGDQASQGITFNLSKHFSNGLSVSANLSHRYNHQDKMDKRLMFRFSMPLQRTAIKQRRQRLSGRYQHHDQTFSVDYWVSPRSYTGIGSLSGKVNIDYQQADETNLEGELRFNSHRFRTSLTHDLVYTQDSSTLTQNTNFSLNTALVFADGQFAWSRPVRDSFALFQVDKSLTDVLPIGIGGNQRQGNEAEINQFGAAVINHLTPYNYRSIDLDVTDLPLGVIVNNQEVTLLPRLGSGFAIKLSGKRGLVVDGVIVDKNDEPLVFQSGQVVSLDDPEESATTFFTNRKGRFRLMSVPPGNYKLDLFDYPETPVKFSVPENHSGLIYKIGTRKLGD